MSESTAARPPRQRTSIYDVARAAGVSVATVSRVLNSKTGVSEELASYVMQVIGRLGYQHRPENHRPGPKRKTDTPPAPKRVLDLFIAHPLALGEFPMRAPIYSRMLDELEEVATANGIDIYVRQAAGRALPQSIEPSVIGRIYFATGAPGIEATAPWRGASIPLVWLFDGDQADFPGHAVRVDNERVGEIAARHLWACNHRHACFIGSPRPYLDRPAVSRSASFSWWFRHLGGTVLDYMDERLIDFRERHNQVIEPELEALLDRCLAATPRPTAIFLEFALFAPAVWKSLVRRGLRPMVDIDLLVCNNDEVFLRGLSPRPWVIDPPCHAMAELAINLVLHGASGGTSLPVRHLVAPVLLR